MPRVRTGADLRTKAANKAANIAAPQGLHTSTMDGAAMVDENKPPDGETAGLRAGQVARGAGLQRHGPRWLQQPDQLGPPDGEDAQHPQGHGPEAQKYAEASQMTRKKVIDMQLEAFERAKLIDEPASMVSAAREIGKICGFYEPKKVELTVNGTVKHEIHRSRA